MRRAGLAALTVLVALAGTVGLIAFFQSRDSAKIDQPANAGQGGPGQPAPEVAPQLKAGNVMLTYRVAADAPTLKALADDIAGPEDPALVDAGQAILVRRRPRQQDRIVAHAWKRRLVANSPSDPQLRAFAETWLGRSAGG